MKQKMKKRLSWLLSFSLLGASVGIWSSGGMQVNAEGEEPVVKMLQNGDTTGLTITYPTPATSFTSGDILYLVAADENGKTLIMQGGVSFGMVEKTTVAKWNAVVKTSDSFKVADWGSNGTLTVKAGDKLSNAIKVEGFKNDTNDTKTEYDTISAILVSDEQDIVAYGSVDTIDNNSASQDMEVGVTMPAEVPDGEYTLHLYAEQMGTCYATNSQSQRIEVKGGTAATASPTASAEPEVTPTSSISPTATTTADVTTAPTNAPVQTTVPSTVPVTTAVPTEIPVQTIAPSSSIVPTNAPVQTVTPSPSIVPTNAPVQTVTPLSSAVPTNVPMQTITPSSSAVPTKAPVQTLTPVPSTVPTKAPVQTLAPVPSYNPTVPTEEPSESQVPVQAGDGEEEQVPEPGSTDTQGNVTYKVTQSGSVAVTKAGTAQTKKVTIPDTVIVDGQEFKVDTISAGAFAGNKKLEQVTLGANIKKVKKKAFRGCTNLEQVTFSNKVTTVGAKSFSGCTSLKKVTLPDSVTTIGARAFKGCKSLKNIKLGKKAQTVKAGAVSVVPYIKTAKNGTVTVESVPVYSAGTSLSLTIGNYAFAACSSMKKVIINSAVRVIGSSAFRGCKKLSDITVNSKILETVRKMALKGINNCTITVPSSKFKPYRTLFRNKGQGKKVLIAKA